MNHRDPAGQLSALVVGGDASATALGRLIRGCPVPPQAEWQAWQALLRLQPDVMLAADCQAQQLRASGVTPTPANLPAMWRALEPLVPVTEDLSWACHLLCEWVGLAAPEADDVVAAMDRDQPYTLAPEALGRVQAAGLADEIPLSFHDVSLSRWAAVATEWDQMQYGVVVVRPSRHLRTLESLHWLAGVGLRLKRSAGRQREHLTWERES